MILGIVPDAIITLPICFAIPLHNIYKYLFHALFCVSASSYILYVEFIGYTDKVAQNANKRLSQPSRSHMTDPQKRKRTGASCPGFLLRVFVERR